MRVTTEPRDAAIQQAAEDYPHRHEDIPDPAQAAELAVNELHDHDGWTTYVPSHWEPLAWLDAYQRAYAAEWRDLQI